MVSPSSETTAAKPTPQHPVVEKDSALFDSDAFRLYCFKVLPCSKRFVHDWPSCPFAHPGEKAKRRDPRTHVYDCEMCQAVARGEACELGAACPHSHHVFESWLHPQKYRTLLCKDGDNCHREVCFFAHGSKQLRTPDRSYQQQRQHYHHKGPHTQLAPAEQDSSSHSSHAAHQPAGQRSSNSRGPSSFLPQHGPNNMAAGGGCTANSNSSSNSSISCAAMPQLQAGPAFNACAEDVTSHPLLQLQTQHMMPAGAHAAAMGGLQLDGDPNMLSAAAGKADLLQLVQTLRAEVSASKQEAAESTRAAVAAQHKLQLLENFLGDASSDNTPGFAGAALQRAASLTSPEAAMHAGDWQTAAAAAGAAASMPLPRVSPMLLQGGAGAAGYGDPGLYPRRHSVDEILLRRARNPAGLSGLGRPVQHLWSPPNAAPSGCMPGLAAVAEGVPAPGGVVRTGSGASAASDIEALAAAFAGAGALGGGGMQAGGYPPGSNAAMLASAATAQLSGGSSSSNSSWLGLSGGMAMQAAGPGVSWAAAAPTALTGGFNSFSHLPAIPASSCHPGGMMCGANSLSAPQLQSEYLQFLLQSGGIPQQQQQQQPVRASFDTAAAYLPPLGGDLLLAPAQTPCDAYAAAAAAAAADDNAAASGSGSGSGSVLRNGSGMSSRQADCGSGAPAACVTDRLLSNPMGGAKQMGWF